MSTSKGSVLSAIFWMAFLSILLFWLPLFGSFIAGYVGGKKAGTAGNAFLAVLLSAALVSFSGVWILLPILPAFISALIGGSTLILLLSLNLPLLSGAIIGGALAK